MAKVVIKKKITRGEYQCGKCGEKIQPGSEYKSWQFLRSPKRFRCMKPTCAPRASELTQSRIGEVYALNERLDDLCSGFRQGKPASFEDFKSDLESLRDDIDSLKDEFQENFDNMPEQRQDGENGQRVSDRVEALESFSNELDSAIDNADWPDEDDFKCIIELDCDGVVIEDGEPCGELEEHGRHKPDNAAYHMFMTGLTIPVDELAANIVSEFEGLSCDCD